MSNPPSNAEIARAVPFLAAQRGFGVNLFRALDAPTNKNILISPFSIAACLGLVRNGVKGPSAASLDRVIGSSDLASLNAASSTARRALISSGEVTVSNAVFGRPKLEFGKPFQEVVKASYDADVSALPDMGPAGVSIVNGWVRGHTLGRIPKILDHFDINESVILLDAVTFDGEWQEGFQESETRQLPFLSPEGPVMSAMMHLNAQFGFVGENRVEELELPYKGGAFSMILMLPALGKPPTDLLKSIDPFEQMGKSSVDSVDVLLPKFRFADEYELKAPLTKVGLGDLFLRCDFTPMVPSGVLEKVTRVIHKTYIEVDEKGTKAGAVAAAVVTEKGDVARSREFHAVRPFAYWIVHKPTKAILFMGVVMSPKF